MAEWTRPAATGGENGYDCSRVVRDGTSDF
jgi:hypothetical protein